MIKVALIGAGNLGSRHLQALGNVKKDISIFVSEPNREAQRIAKSRYDECPINNHVKSLVFVDDYKKLPAELDVVIIATSADQRFQIATWVVKNIKVNHLVLEKVVFQSIEQFDEFDKTISSKDLKIWVNCPRRMFDSYKRLNERIDTVKQLDMVVDGFEWGLACNAIHMMDLYSYLSGKYEYSYDIKGLENGVFDSKRPGYKELYGKLVFLSTKGSLTLNCKHGQGDDLVITIKTEGIAAEIHEEKGVAYLEDINQAKKEEIPFEILYQSGLTNEVVEDLLENGKCDLATYEESKKIHKVMISAMLEHINSFSNKETKICPIT